ncbi:MAG TPA: EAL domain-containing protein [Deltaproteobacteria bacterium]|nr:EAL domain-containing protein [Deltaproteobacteria bacterium]
MTGVQPFVVYSMLLLGMLLPVGLLTLAGRRFSISRSLLGQIPESLPPVIVLLLGMIFWSVAYSLELLTHDPIVMRRLHQFAFTGTAVVPMAVLLVALALVFDFRITTRAWIVAMALPVTTIGLAWTNPAHGLVWTSFETVAVGQLTSLKTTEGPWFWVHTYSSYAFMGVAVVLLAMRSHRVWSTSPGESVALIATIGIPWILNAVYLFTTASPVDPTPLAGLVSATILFGVVARDRVKTLVPSASGALFERTGDPMLLLDREGRIVHVNREGARYLDAEIDSLLGSPLHDVWPEFDFVAGCEGRHPDLRLRNVAEAAPRDFDVRLFPGGSSSEDSPVFILALRDITERRRAEAIAAEAADRDEQTGLANRRCFRETLARWIAEARDEHGLLALFILDIDDLKLVNDLYGQNAGDESILSVASALEDGRVDGGEPIESFPGRLGGDEFALLVRGMSRKEEIEGLATRLQRRIGASASCEFQVSASIGISLLSGDSPDLSSLFRQADLACRVAQRDGRGLFRFFEPEIEAKLDRQATVSRALWKAIRAGDFTLVFQPKVELPTGSVIGFEALIRWTSDELGFVSPEEFIAIAEKNGSIQAIGRWVLTRTCSLLAQWRAEGVDEVRVAVNVSALELRDPDFSEFVFACLEEHRVDPAQLEFEITERSFLGDDAEMATALNALRSAGIHISLDDFGTGYATLACLSRIDLDSIKMDRSLVLEVELDGRATSVAATVVTLARMLEMKVIAEGVETVEQAEMLCDLRCHQAQGYLFSRPVPPEEVPLLARARLPLGKPDPASSAD